jgi:hypothetical protein
MPRLASTLALILTLAGGSAIAGTPTGEFLFIENNGAGLGGIWGVDVTGTNFFAVTAASGFGFSTTTPPYPSPDIQEFSQAKNNGRIGFMSVMNPNDSARIYVMNGDGTGVKQVTFHNPSVSSAAHSEPSISADGSKIIYVNAETIAPAGTMGTGGTNCSGTQTSSYWVVNTDGTNPHVVRQPTFYDVHCNHGAAGEAVWSPDGTKLLVADTMGDSNSPANCGNEIVVVDPSTGNNIQTLACNNGWGITQVGLDWSPDGTKAMALVTCGGAGQEHTCTQWVVWDTSTWDVISTIPTPSGNDEFMTRFSPDSTMLGYYYQNVSPHTMNIMDLYGNPVSSFSMASVNADPGGAAGSLVWSASTPGALQTLTLAVPSAYVNSCPNYTLYLEPSEFNSSGTLIAHGYTSANVDITSGDGDSFHIDGFGNAYFVATRNSASGTLQLSSFSANSPTIPITTDQNCNCQTSPSGVSVTRGGLRYVTSSQQQFLQTLTVTNNSGSAIAGPINIVIQGLPSTVTLTNASGTTGCTSSGSPFMTVVPANGSLAAGQSASIQLDFRDPSLGGFTYTTAVTAGFGAP